MRKVRFLLKSYIDGMVREAGSEHWIGEDVPLHEHMVDVETEQAGEHFGPSGHIPWYLDHSGDARLDDDATSQSGGYNPVLAERKKG